ncbi:MAG: hypothetical protein KC736_02415 [Candidatus Moranbacteria bacterium]|nr:hypothetical protein [Candidatus Moranbacteria bacterium]
MDNKQVFVAGPLTHASDHDAIRATYSAVGALCRRVGLLSFVPHEELFDLLVGKKSRADVVCGMKMFVLSHNVIC